MIHIKGDWYIDVDERSYNLMKFAGTYNDKNGKECNSYTNITYHSTLAAALNQYAVYVVRDALEPDMEIKEAVQTLWHAVAQAKEDITGITGGL